MIVGGVIFLVAFLGCCGAWKESKCLIYTYAFFLAVILVAQVLLVHILSKTGPIFFVLSNTEQTFFWEVLHLWIHNCRCWISCQVCNLFCKVYSSQGSWCGNILRKWRIQSSSFAEVSCHFQWYHPAPAQVSCWLAAYVSLFKLIAHHLFLTLIFWIICHLGSLRIMAGLNSYSSLS